MMDGVTVDKIEFVDKGFKDILASDGVKNLVEQHTEAICSRANANLTQDSEGYVTKIYPPSDGVRWVGVVAATDHASMVDEAENKSLSRAVQ